jgi:hypothetical protein
MGAADDFCGEIDRALACHDDKDRCLAAYHHSVTNRLAKTKTVMEFSDNPVRLNDLDAIYTAGKELLSSDLRATASTDFEKKRTELHQECLDSFP